MEASEEINPLLKLDTVLMFLHVRPGEMHDLDVITEGIKDEINSDDNEVSLIIKKLLKDEYIEQYIQTRINNILPIPAPYQIFVYYINFSGNIFIKQGGYTVQEAMFSSENKKLEILKFDQIKRDEFLKTLTIWIAFGAIVASVYYSIEIYKALHLFAHHHGRFWIWEIIK